MDFAVLVFMIAVLNFVLGYALAVYLGFGPPTLAELWKRRGSARRIEKMCGDHEHVVAEPLQEPLQTPQVVSPTDAPLPAATEEASDPALEPKLSELDTFRRCVATSVSSLTDFAAKLRASNLGESHRDGWSFVAELQGICQPYLERLKHAAERLPDQLGDEVQELVLEQLAQLETTLSNLQYMNFDSGFWAAIRRLSQETAHTLSMACSLRDAIAGAHETTENETCEDAPTAEALAAEQSAM